MQKLVANEIEPVSVWNPKTTFPVFD